MKNIILIITFCAATALVVGCRPSVEQSIENTSAQLDKVRKETRDTVPDLKDYTYAQKETFVAKMQAKVTEINRDLDELSTKVDKAPESVQAEARPKIQVLRDQSAQLDRQLDEAKNANESTWNDIKNGTNKAYESFKDSWQQSRQWVSEKIAP